MKVWIEEDEYWPYYFVDLNGQGEIEANIDPGLFEHFETVTQEWKAVQNTLKEMYLKGFSND